MTKKKNPARNTVVDRLNKSIADLKRHEDHESKLKVWTSSTELSKVDEPPMGHAPLAITLRGLIGGVSPPQHQLDD